MIVGWFTRAQCYRIDSITSLLPTVVHGASVADAEDLIKRWEAGELVTKERTNTNSEPEPEHFDPILDSCMDGDHNCVKVEVPDMDSNLLTVQLHNRIQTRDLGAEISVSIVDEVNYLQKQQ